MYLSHCAICGQEVISPTKGQRDASKRRGWAYCSRECSGAYSRWSSSMTMAATNRAHASARMTARNPMHREDVRQLVSTKLRAMGWKPPVQGGNGKPAPPAQLLIASALGWEMEVVVRTGHGTREGSGFPPCYKLDVGNRALMVGIEVDGLSHCSLERQAQDRKKDAKLRSLGWTVLRFSNREVIESLQKCVDTVMSTISKLQSITTTSRRAS